ncbi:DinB family protein [Pedobacter nutrimenti]|jgi:uncharacterized damage-inducible protein DinB|uniref:Putative damage-inducible protein DinB n=1 Tax=Pedobacter nutrimenti TaxID=1241337 RepID=A0A318UCW6_9SPHI|nr:DinB family protein [Pedobacter nutrimenti]PYF74051.1 putative damage-inducible protein DinB [Pedobacter nutrimenti]
MYRNITDFLNDWKYESENTAKVFSMITHQSRQTVLNENVRSLERLAWHLSQTITDFGYRSGLLTSDPLDKQPIPESMTALTAIYQDYAEQFAKAVHSKWTDSSLTDEVDMYGSPWTKGTLLRILITHQSHHRGQMTIIMRMLGLAVPGVYGPTKEEWAGMGIPAQE